MCLGPSHHDRRGALRLPISQLHLRSSRSVLSLVKVDTDMEPAAISQQRLMLVGRVDIEELYRARASDGPPRCYGHSIAIPRAELDRLQASSLGRGETGLPGWKIDIDVFGRRRTPREGASNDHLLVEEGKDIIWGQQSRHRGCQRGTSPDRWPRPSRPTSPLHSPVVPTSQQTPGGSLIDPARS